MKLAHGTALIAALLVTGLATPAMAAEPVDAAVAEEGSATEVRNSHRERAEQAQAEAAQSAAEAVRSATKLDLDIRLIGPTSIAGDL
jgi:TRAP-type C4-dicarboxylate transport system substrate-binding protein